MFWFAVGGAVLVFALGIWIGMGAPGWPHKPTSEPGRLKTKDINPIAWGRGTARERQRPRSRDSRRRR
ncbi:MAG TPA: hypothetical protein VFI91_09795 [Longimicrobiaceae bacterium]|nr:hypothetical protein [Longimicrobiaceae bacterium]